MTKMSDKKYENFTWEVNGDHSVSTRDLIVSAEEAKRIADELKNDPCYGVKRAIVLYGKDERDESGMPVSRYDKYRIEAGVDDPQRFIEAIEAERARGRPSFSWNR